MTSVGAPTLVLNKRCPVEYEAVPEAFGDIDQAWLSYPLARKHMSFDGRLLHGAPHVLAALCASDVRVTFLANIWLNYHPSGLEAFPASELGSFKLQRQDVALRQSALLTRQSSTQLLSLHQSAHETHTQRGHLALNFGGHSGAHWQAMLPDLPHSALSRLPQGSSISLRWPAAAAGKPKSHRSERKKRRGETSPFVEAGPQAHQARLQAGPGLTRPARS